MAGNIPGQREKAGMIRVVIFTALRIFNLHYQPVVFTLERKMQEQCFSLFQPKGMELSVDCSLPGRIFNVDFIYWCILNLIRSQDHTSVVTFHFIFFLLSIINLTASEFLQSLLNLHAFLRALYSQWTKKNNCMLSVLMLTR